eukprot:TRINITY_DN13489_c0_g1_i2.p2 TRINITY_DN13489_c0_g1~~TRINITY_DN13489_c0_g1_i2.p2  ORF type:complete len:414 (+),score=66.53 TRINITY_DN13489_c0_g1_i2:1740-2981(+)
MADEMTEELSKPVSVFIEACVTDRCTLSLSEVKREVFELIAAHRPTFFSGQPIPFHHSALADHLRFLEVGDLMQPVVPFNAAAPQIFVYQLHTDESTAEHIGAPDDMFQDAEGSTVQACEVTTMPNVRSHRLWESLHFDTPVKLDLLRYAETAMLFAERGVDAHLVGCNRVVLLHGPPGTGKTSICKALAHKLSIYLGNRFSSTFFVEVSAHSLLSKYFSESGKLVVQLFGRIRAIIRDERRLCFVLVDEVESLTAARKAALSGTEPSDALRVVNAVLTQLDLLRPFPNVFLLATSNLHEAVDVAFVDRADLKLYLGAPGSGTRLHILRTAVEELVRRRVVDLRSWGQTETNEALFRLAESCQGLSGRALRRLPFLAVVKSARTYPFCPLSPVDFFTALQASVDQALNDLQVD